MPNLDNDYALDYDDGDDLRKKCCGCPIESDFSQITRCPAVLTIVQIVLNALILILSIVVIAQRMDEDGENFMCTGSLVAFITCVLLSMTSSISLLCFYIAVHNSKTNKRLKSWVKSLDLASAILMLIGFVIELYIMIKWQLNRLNTKNESIPYLGEMAAISAFTFINTVLYFIVECVK